MTRSFLISMWPSILVPGLLIVGMVATMPQVLGPFCLAAVPTGLVAAGIIRLRNERQAPISLFHAPAEIGRAEPARPDRPVSAAGGRRITLRLRRLFSRTPKSPEVVPAMETGTQPQDFDPRPYRFHLRWDREFGTYSNHIRNREENKAFRHRVYNEFRSYAEYGLDTLALCNVVRKSTAFAEAECAEIIKDLLQNY